MYLDKVCCFTAKVLSRFSSNLTKSCCETADFVQKSPKFHKIQCIFYNRKTHKNEKLNNHKTELVFMRSCKPKQGWYRLRHPEKFMMPLDEHMESTKIFRNDLYLQYKSSLELHFMQYCDINKSIDQFSLEPFSIPYIKPTDGKKHRYYIDFFIVINDQKIMIEIKPYSQTILPNKPKKPDQLPRYKKELETYFINQAKWKAATNFAEQKGFKFVIMTDKDIIG